MRSPPFAVGPPAGMATAGPFLPSTGPGTRLRGSQPEGAFKAVKSDKEEGENPGGPDPPRRCQARRQEIRPTSNGRADQGTAKDQGRRRRRPGAARSRPPSGAKPLIPRGQAVYGLIAPNRCR